MTWLYQGQFVETLPEDCVGFVYLVTNTTNNKKYIGKKLAKFAKTTYKTIKLKNGKKKRKKIRGTRESDWQTYYGSNIQLNQDVVNLGTENFTREILHYCRSKAECSYREAKLQFEHRVLESDDYYNGQIVCRIHGSHIKKLF
jgi:hypothetical protein